MAGHDWLGVGAQAEVPEAALRHARAREVAVHMSAQALSEGDRGRIIVGASIQLGDLTLHDAARLPHHLHRPDLAPVSKEAAAQCVAGAAEVSNHDPLVVQSQSMHATLLHWAQCCWSHHSKPL